jgi:S-adenosylmethionine decarboxylase
MSNKKSNNNKQVLEPMIDIKTSETFVPDDNAVFEETDVEHEYAGKHYIVDFWGTEYLQNIEFIERALNDAACIADATLLHIHLHQFTTGGGITGVALLAESHISVHTWPERDYAAFDVFMCGDARPDKAVALLQEAFKPSKFEVTEILRGKKKNK